MSPRDLLDVTVALEADDGYSKRNREGRRDRDSRQGVESSCCLFPKASFGFSCYRRRRANGAAAEDTASPGDEEAAAVAAVE